MSIAAAHTVERVIDDTLKLAGDYRGTRRNGRRWMRGEVMAVLNRVLFQMARSTGALRTVYLLPVVEGQQVYTLPTDCIQIFSARLDGLTGQVVLPSSVGEQDHSFRRIDQVGRPRYAFGDTLAYNQIGLLNVPGASGSQCVRTDEFGVIRFLETADGTRITTESSGPAVRTVGGVPLIRTAEGGILRGVVPIAGNIVATYIRRPVVSSEGDIPHGLPAWCIRRLRFGAAANLLGMSRKRMDQGKARVYSARWERSMASLRRHSQYLGNLEDVTS